MKCIKNIFVTYLFCFCTCSICAAQNDSTDSLNVENSSELTDYDKFWLKLAPTHLKLHYAGSMGFMSAGFGTEYGKRRQWETDFYLGFLPKFEGPTNELTFTLKENYSAWDIPIDDNWTFEPFTIGFFLTWTTGEHLWGRLPEEYPANYYYFTTALRINMCVGERITYKMKRDMLVKSMSFFYEFNSNDLYVASVWDNSNLRVYDIIKLSFGLKMTIR